MTEPKKPAEPGTPGPQAIDDTALESVSAASIGKLQYPAPRTGPTAGFNGDIGEGTGI